MAARTMEGVHPVIKVKRMDTGISTRAVLLRFPISSRDSSPARKARWDPDTATVWVSPVRCKSVWKESDSPSRLPVTSALTRGDTPSEKRLSTLSSRVRVQKAGQSRRGGYSGRSTAKRP